MGKDNFILMSLNDDDSKKLAQVISNDTSRKILDYLADKEGSETEISKKLNIPLPTVHYNMKALVKGGLVLGEEYHYSEKGKEVIHYKLANKYVIIAPKSTFGIKEKLKRILPIALIGIVGAWFVNFFSLDKVANTDMQAKAMAAPRLMMDEAVEENAGAMLAKSADVIQSTFVMEPWMWFLVGVLFSIIFLIIIEYIIYKRK